MASLSKLGMAVELEPEPEGGDEISAVDDTLPGSRAKNMGEVDDVSSEDGTVYKFWLTAEADGAKIKEYRTTILKDAAKKANFPGFRKGQVPPYAQPQITGFAVQEGLVKTVESAVSAYGLKALPGSDGEVTVNEEVKDICQGYKVGDSIPFTAYFNAVFDPELAAAAEEAVESEEVTADSE
mmetsp:Transcript_21546/g.26013  ORF Transcript_21546/g.26013 Transcript_21546/m.26013 type:complete len:182 (+) Transcript_21546:4-549(+)